MSDFHEPSAFRSFLGSVLKLAGALALVGLGYFVALILWDTRARIVNTDEKTNMVFCRVFPERCAPVVPPAAPAADSGPTGNTSAPSAHSPDPPKR